jgi:hypothetical protein
MGKRENCFVGPRSISMAKPPLTFDSVVTTLREPEPEIVLERGMFVSYPVARPT